MVWSEGGKSRMVVIVVLALFVAGGVGAFTLKSMGHKKGGHEKKAPVSSMPLGEFVVNLADTGDIRYLKADIVLEVEGAVAKGGGHGEASGPDPRVRDAVIQVLSSRRFAELVKPEGKEKLKKDIVAAVNERLHDAKAVEVFFSEFAMQ